MSRIVRLSLALLFALMMVIATASAALAFDPPANRSGNDDASSLCELEFPAIGAPGVDPMGGGGLGPWHAVFGGPDFNGANQIGPIPFGECPE